MAKKSSSRRVALPEAQNLSRNRSRRQTTRHGAPATGKGYWIYGQHAVEAALLNPARVIYALLATKEAEASLPETTHQPRIVSREELDALCGKEAVHQGVCLNVEPLENPALVDVIDRPGPILVLDQVTDPRNIGAILRSAAAFGAAALIVQDRHTPEETGTMAKAASGGLDIVPIIRETNISRTLQGLQKAGFWVVGLDAGGVRLDRNQLGERRIALVLGAEGAGLRRLTRETCDEIASIYMSGPMESLNVSNASAVALYELTRPLD